MEVSFLLEALLVPVGLAVSLRGAQRAWKALRRPARELSRNAGWMAGFRLFVLGAATAGCGAALLLDATWLLVLSLAIGGEEVLESTLLLDGLRRGAKISLRP
jgi:hypothetical protein